MDYLRLAFRPALITSVVLAAVTVVLLALSSASASDEDSRSARDVRAQDQVERELPELRTASSRTFATGAGSFLTRAYTEPVNYRSGGKWEPIDNNLKAG